MAEKFRPQRVRTFYPLAGSGPFLSNPSDISSGNSRRPYTGSFQVSSVKPHERTGTHLSKRVSTAVDYSRRRHNYRESPRTLEASQLDATGEKPTLKDPSCKSPNEASGSVAEDGESAMTNEIPAVVETEITRPKRTITVFLPSLKMTDDEDDIVVMDNCKSYASLSDAAQGATNTQQNLIDGQSRDDQRSVVASSNDRAQLDQSNRKKSAVPVYKIKYVHFDKNRAAVGHARQITNRLYAINVQRQSSALNRIELA